MTLFSSVVFNNSCFDAKLKQTQVCIILYARTNLSGNSLHCMSLWMYLESDELEVTVCYDCRLLSIYQAVYPGKFQILKLVRNQFVAYMDLTRPN